MPVRWSQEEEQRQAGAATEQGMDSISAQEGPSVVVRGVADSRIRVTTAPGQDGRAIHDQVAPSNQVDAYR